MSPISPSAGLNSHALAMQLPCNSIGQSAATMQLQCNCNAGDQLSTAARYDEAQAQVKPGSVR